jgi:hypothetical protein
MPCLWSVLRVVLQDQCTTDFATDDGDISKSWEEALAGEKVTNSCLYDFFMIGLT